MGILERKKNVPSNSTMQRFVVVVALVAVCGDIGAPFGGGCYFFLPTPKILGKEKASGTFTSLLLVSSPKLYLVLVKV
jgi:hypothetical protein